MYLTYDDFKAVKIHSLRYNDNLKNIECQIKIKSQIIDFSTWKIKAEKIFTKQ
jgi:hypothetical protein